jgi:hypothetical protein
MGMVSLDQETQLKRTLGCNIDSSSDLEVHNRKLAIFEKLTLIMLVMSTLADAFTSALLTLTDQNVCVHLV